MHSRVGDRDVDKRSARDIPGCAKCHFQLSSCGHVPWDLRAEGGELGSVNGTSDFNPGGGRSIRTSHSITSVHYGEATMQ